MVWLFRLTISQRVLNDSSRTRLSLRRMIWLLPYPLPPPPSPVSKLSIFLSLPVCKRRGVGGWGRSQPKSYDSAPCSPPYPTSPLMQSSRVSSVYCSLLTGHGEGRGGRGAKSNGREKAWSPVYESFKTLWIQLLAPLTEERFTLNR
jgi:hypothetical protein